MTRRYHRSFVLVAVLIIVMIALLVATGLVFLAQAEVASTSVERDAVQSRLIAWSGVQIMTTRLDDQRQRILDGQMAQLDETYVVYDTDGATGVIRLLPVAPGDEVIAYEAGRLDLNHASAGELAATELIDEDVARRIVSYREGRGVIQSVAELLDVDGVTPEVLYGPLEDHRAVDAGMRRDETPSGLADVVTVYGFEPALQRSGDLRINLNVPWSDELGRRIDQRFGEGASEVLKGIFDEGHTFEDESKIVEVMQSTGIEPKAWGEILDALTVTEGDYLFGRLDLNSASYESLLSCMEADVATQIVRRRDDLAPEDRAYITWPVTEDIVEAESFASIAGAITTRCWTFRVRFEAGEVVDGGLDGELVRPVVYEAVIDLSGPQTRVAYLRDVTMFETAVRLDPGPDPDADPADDLREDDRSPDDVSEEEIADPDEREAMDDGDFPIREEGSPFEDDAPWPDDEMPPDQLEDDPPFGRDEDMPVDGDRESPEGDDPGDEGTGATSPSAGGGAPAGQRVGRWRGGS